MAAFSGCSSILECPNVIKGLTRDQHREQTGYSRVCLRLKLQKIFFTVIRSPSSACEQCEIVPRQLGFIQRSGSTGVCVVSLLVHHHPSWGWAHFMVGLLVLPVSQRSARKEIKEQHNSKSVKNNRVDAQLGKERTRRCRRNSNWTWIVMVFSPKRSKNTPSVMQWGRCWSVALNF